MSKDKGAWLEAVMREHLPYEMEMLAATFAKLETVERDDVVLRHDVVLRNAVMESFCIHARALIDFFKGRKGAKASDFTGKPYLATHVDTLPRTLIDMLNEQVAHLSPRRPSDAGRKLNKKDREQILGILEAEKEAFLQQINSEYQKIYKERTDAARHPSATTSIQSTASVTFALSQVTVIRKTDVTND